MTTTLLLIAALVSKSCTTMSGTSTTLRIGGRTLITRRRRHLTVRGLWWYVAKLRWRNLSAVQSLQLGFHSLANSVSYQGISCTPMSFLVVLLTRMDQLAHSLRRGFFLPCQWQVQVRKATSYWRTSSGSVSWFTHRRRRRKRSVKR